MFSITDSRDRLFVSWNVRTMPVAGQLVAGLPGDVLAVERPHPAVGLVEAGQQVEERRLAGAVRADQGRDEAPRDLDVIDVDGDEAAVLAVHAVGDEDRIRLRRARLERHALQRVGDDAPGR